MSVWNAVITQGNIVCQRLGIVGPTGPTGATGAAGPNTVTGSTTTTLTGYLKGTGSIVSASTTVAAADLTGTVDDARLSANVPLKNADNTFSGILVVTSQLSVGIGAEFLVDDAGNVTAASIISNSIQSTPVSPFAADSVGTAGEVQRSFSEDTNIAASDCGKMLYHPASDANIRVVTILANTSLALDIGHNFEIINDSANDVTLAITDDTLIQAATGTTGSITIPQYGTCFVRKVAATRWYATPVVP